MSAREQYRKQQQAQLFRQQAAWKGGTEEGDELLRKAVEAQKALNPPLELGAPPALAGAPPPPGASESSVMLGTADDFPVSVSVALRMERVPTGIIHLLSESDHPLVEITVANDRDDEQRVRLSTWVEGYSAHCVRTLTLGGKGSGKERESVVQLPTFFVDAIRQLNELTRATVHVSVDVLNGGVQEERTLPIWLLARNAAFNAIRDPSTGSWTDLTPYYGAYVTPNEPSIMLLLRDAAAKAPNGILSGYQADPAPQIAAIFDALKAKGITYVNSILTFGASPDEAMQRVRLPRQSLAERSANCIDGVLLMASLLEAASFNPAIVIVPGHAFVGWETSRGSGKFEYVETTLLGSATFAQARQKGNDEWAALQAQAKRHDLETLRVVNQITPME